MMLPGTSSRRDRNGRLIAMALVLLVQSKAGREQLDSRNCSRRCLAAINAKACSRALHRKVNHKLTCLPQ
jgi:hypothetical protein